MQIKIESPSFELTPAIQTQIEKKLSPLKKFIKSFEKEKEVLIFVEVKKVTKHHKHGEIFQTLVKLNLNGEDLIAESNDINFQTSLDIVKDKIKENILKYKEKIIQKNKNKKLRK